MRLMGVVEIPIVCPQEPFVYPPTSDNSRTVMNVNTPYQPRSLITYNCCCLLELTFRSRRRPRQEEW